jgi:hypothetical protein
MYDHEQTIESGCFFGRLVDVYAQCGSKIGRFPYKFGDMYV